MLTHLVDVSSRSLLLVLAAVIVLWMLRSRRSAAIQHAVWTTVVCGMLALFAFGETLPRMPVPVPARPVPSAPTPFTIPMLTDEPPEPPQFSAPLPATTSRPIDWSAIAIYAWAAVACAFLAQFLTGILLIRKLVASARLIQLAGGPAVHESDRIAVPITVGWLNPKILLPPDWRLWDSDKLHAVLTHEAAHARRRDNLVSALAAVNRRIFWFHPLAWILERKLALLAEQACDESCVAALGDRTRYAQLLLEMASVVDSSQGRLRYHALTMAAASHIRQRIDSLLQEGRTFSRGLTWIGWATVTLCGIPLVFGAGAVELDRQPPILTLEMPHWKVPSPPVLEQKPLAKKPVLLAQTQVPPVQAAVPKFEVASVKPCAPGSSGSRGGKSGSPATRGGGGRGFDISPGRLNITCMSVWDLINTYLQNGNDPLVNDSGPFDTTRIKGGSAWAYSDWYTISAETDDPVATGPTDGRNPAKKVMMGPMLQSLLEERFQLRTHRQVEVIPMYALTVTKGGPKLKPMEPGSCTPLDPATGARPSEMSPPSQKPPCISHVGWDGPNWTMDATGRTLSDFAAGLSLIMDRHVIDKTGIAGQFDFHLVFAHDESAPGNFPDGLPSPFTPTDIPPGPSVFTVLEQQLGLKLVQDQGPHGYIVIDSIQRPSEN